MNDFRTEFYFKVLHEHSVNEKVEEVKFKEVKQITDKYLRKRVN